MLNIHEAKMASEGKAEFTQLETLSRNVQVNIVHLDCIYTY